MASAKESWAARERALTERPEATSGKTITGMAIKTSADNFALVMIIIMMAPKNKNRLRSSMEAEAPKADFICVVSAVRRDNNSPILD